MQQYAVWLPVHHKLSVSELSLAAQARYCLTLFKEGKTSDFMIGMGYKRAAISSAQKAFFNEPSTLTS